METLDESHVPLVGVRILDATDYLSGPFAGLILSDLGASVLKVERPTRGDPFRRFGHLIDGKSVLWLNVNQGKYSIECDLTSSAGQELFLDLAEVADVMVTNWRPGKADALGLSDATLKAVNHRLIHLRISGFGPSGPYSDRPAFDYVIQALSGAASGRHPGDRPRFHPFLIDKLTSVFAVQAILAALYRRGSTDRGEVIDLAMLDVAAYFNFPDAFQHSTFLSDTGTSQDDSVPVVRTRDGYVVVAPVSGQQISRVLGAIGRPEWSELLRAKRGSDFMSAFVELLESRTQEMSSAELVQLMVDADVPVGEVLDPQSHLNDPQVVSNEVYRHAMDPELGPYRQVRYPARTGRSVAPTRRRSPDLGECPSEVLADWLPSEMPTENRSAEGA